MIKLNKIILATIGITTVAFAAPKIAANNPDTYFNGGNGTQSKDIVIKPLQLELEAPAWISMNYRTGEIVSDKNMDTKREPASLTKVMAAYIIASELKAGTLKMDELVTISHDAHATGGSRMFIREGDRISVKNLLTGVIVDSGNDATIALAEHIAGTPENFTSLMNQTAKSIGMKNTHFANPDGLPGGEQYTTARDMALLARSFIYNFPEEYKLYSQKSFEWENIKQNNRNRLLYTFDGADGMKTGYTNAAGYCLIASAQVDGERYITVVLGTANQALREQESAKLMRYSLTKFENVVLYKANSPITTSADSIKYAKAGQKITVLSTDNIYKTVPKSYIPYLKQGIDCNKDLIVPIKKGTVVGNLVVTINDGAETIASTPVVAQNDIAKSGWF